MTGVHATLRRVRQLRLPGRTPARGAAATPLALAQQVVADVDATCSRFRDDSDLTRANRHPGRWVDVDPLLVAAVAVAREAAEESGGLVSPLLGRPLVQLGYDRDLGRAPGRRRRYTDLPVDVPAPDAWRAIGLDRSGRIRVPDGTALDLGATGKAFAADLVATAVERELGVPAVVSLGGDVRVAAPDGRPWSVAVSEHPGAAPATTVWIDRGGLATSSHAGPPLVARRRCPPPPARPAHRPAGAGGVAHRHRHGSRPAWPPTPPARRPSSSATTRPAWLARTRRDRPARRVRRHGPLPRRLAGRHHSGGMTVNDRAMTGHDEGPFLWYLNRGTGVVVLVLLTITTVLGVVALGNRSGRGLPRFVSQALHRNLALLSVVAAGGARGVGGGRRVRRDPLVAVVRAVRAAATSRCGSGWALSRST